jgi:hypothetical protein
MWEERCWGFYPTTRSPGLAVSSTMLAFGLILFLHFHRMVTLTPLNAPSKSFVASGFTTSNIATVFLYACPSIFLSRKKIPR